MDGLLRNCATGCRVDEAFTMDDLVDSISANTSGLRCGHVQLRIVFITPLSSLRIQSGTRLACHFPIALWQSWSEGAADPALGADSFPLTGPTWDITAAVF
ncbi:hypothetical protein DPX16_12449 [Anabarilius grahami]|uniref:Uncharacterized protein n=1 Tax=Anabarilius grahami TaxID=495550 RepID=A0A3N0XHV2_ANAGA|nr:hypothetical protein DPX16_12449 [Anabarilius grahami]